jgi:hypothetical protein
MSLVNRITGNIAANVLDGGAGGDRLTGGQGDDTYVFDNVDDKAIEKAGNGIDTVLSSVGLAMDAGVDNVTLTGVAAINATGNGLDNLMIGNSAANELNGFTGADEMRGGDGNDTYTIDNVGGRRGRECQEGIGHDHQQEQPDPRRQPREPDPDLDRLDRHRQQPRQRAARQCAGQHPQRCRRRRRDAWRRRLTTSYSVDNVGDTVIEGSGNGTDTVNSSVSFSLSAFVENLTLTGSAKHRRHRQRPGQCPPRQQRQQCAQRRHRRRRNARRRR